MERLHKTQGANLSSFHQYLWLVVGIFIFLFSNGRWMTPICAWLAPVFLLRFIKHKKTFMAPLVLFLLILAATRIIYHGIIPSLLGLLTYILILYYAILAFFPYLIHRWISPKLSGFFGTLIFPITVVAIEYVNTVLFGSWASIAYTQFGNLPIIQISSIFGIWGITFIVMWFGPVLNWIWDHKFEWSKIKKGTLVYSAILTGVLIYGGFRLGVSSPDAATTRVASLTATTELNALRESIQRDGFSSSLNMAVEQRDGLREILDPVYKAIFLHTSEVAKTGASLVFWPEGMIVVCEEDQPQFLSLGKDVAQSDNIHLLLAYFMIPQKDPYNSGENKSVLINPEGQIEWEYLKTHPVPGSSDKAGDGKVPITQTSFGRVSSVICYDMDFTGLIRKAGKSKADIMIVPAWDWKAIDPLHAHMAVFRAVENGFSMVRQTGEGLSIAVDYQGRILAAMDHFTSDNHVMIAEVPTEGTFTVYSWIGDLFAWICVVGTFIFLAWGLFRRPTA